MNKNITLTALFLFSLLTINAKTIFVKVATTGNGTTWEDATGDLLAALFAAQSGDEIWVARGTYLPTNDGDRKITFTIPDNVKVLGGFIGNETSSDQRNAELNKTILSGDIGKMDDFSDNSYSVISFVEAGPHTILDGFTIIDGAANGAGQTGEPCRAGAGIYIKKANPTISNCIVQNNYARDGGAVYNNGIGSTCSPSFINCAFYNNRADLDGGAIFNDGRRGGVSSPTFTDCEFIENEGNYGGAMCNYGGKGKSSPKLVNCLFKDNKAYLRGGGIFNMDVEGIAAPILKQCQFVENKAVAGKGIYTFSSPKNSSVNKILTTYSSN
ncbi:MAG: hypothetical protein NXI23_03800 [Bacteroidetes bacterium]|nr:hypothetical protein [Bacteroidota bacterium]MDF1865493.1 hypothetical protein [Saprospiraceae bacterium]